MIATGTQTTQPPTNAAARSSMPAAAPSAGTRVALRGLTPEQTAEAQRLIHHSGWTLESSLNKAEMVVLGADAPETVRRLAERTTAQQTSWEDFQRLVHLGSVAVTAAEPLPDTPQQPAFELGDTVLRICDVELDRRLVDPRESLIPPAERFAHLCVDAPLLTATRACALAVQHRLPCLLEGETATAKTTAVLWLAHLLRQGVVRLNLNGQTDAGELVGRYAPEPSGGWRFAEGAIPQSMRHGRWVILDEVNLAEAQVLERLNPVLEDPAGLVLSEGDGTVLGPGGDAPVHAAFRLFATMNPAEYAGRSGLSPAFRDRFVGGCQVTRPGEAQLAALLRRLATGVQPEVVVAGRRWKAPDGDPVLPALGRAPEILALLDRVAVFHASVAKAAGEGGGPASLGRTRRDRYAVSRRSLLAFARMLDAAAQRDPGHLDGAAARIIEDLYLARIEPGEDRNAVQAAMRAAGLGAA